MARGHRARDDDTVTHFEMLGGLADLDNDTDALVAHCPGRRAAAKCTFVVVNVRGADGGRGDADNGVLGHLDSGARHVTDDHLEGFALPDDGAHCLGVVVD